MIRISAALAAPLLALTLLSTPANAAAASKPVAPGHLLTSAHVTMAFPTTAPLVRTTRRIRTTSVFRSCSGVATLRVRSGRRVEIAPSNMATTSTAGVPNVTQEVVQMRNARAAKKLVKVWRTLPARCATVQQDGFISQMSRLTVPALGKQRTGVTFTTKVGADNRVADVHVVRRGKRVLTLIVSYSQGPRRTNSAVLLRAAYGRAF